MSEVRNHTTDEVEPSGDMASPPPINWGVFGTHAAAMEEAFRQNPQFDLWLMCNEGTEEDFEKLVEKINTSKDPIAMIRKKLANVFVEDNTVVARLPCVDEHTEVPKTNQ